MQENFKKIVELKTRDKLPFNLLLEKLRAGQKRLYARVGNLTPFENVYDFSTPDFLIEVKEMDLKEVLQGEKLNKGWV